MGYGYYDYMKNYYESYYDNYYEYYYWPYYYGNYNGSNSTWYNGTYPPSPYVYKPAYNIDVITPPLFGVIIICALLSLAILVLIVYKIWEGKRKKAKAGQKLATNNITIGLTIFCAVMHFGQNLIDPFSYYTWFIEYDPDINHDMYIGYETFWCLSKVSLYFLFIYRYYLIYKAQSMMYGGFTMRSYVTFGSFAMAMVAQCALYVTYMILRYELIEYSDPERGQRIFLNVCWAFLFIDLGLIGILGWLLSHSLLKLIVNINTLSGSRKGKNKIRVTLPSTTANNTSMRTSTQTPEETSKGSINVTMSSKPTKVETQLSEYVAAAPDSPKDIALDVSKTGNGEMSIKMQSGTDDIDVEDMRLFLIDYDLNDGDILQKIKNGRIRLNHLVNIEENDLSELCVTLGFGAMQKIRFKSAIKDLKRDYAEDALSVDSMGSRSTSDIQRYKSKKKSKKEYKSKKNKKLNDLMHTTTRIALTMVLSMLSSFIYQFLWLLAFELDNWDMMWISYTWCVDAVVNMLCVYLSMGFATNHYRIICHDCCKWHQCMLKCIQKIVPDSKN